MDKPVRVKSHPIGSIIPDGKGYVRVAVGQGVWKPQHRYVMEQYLDRPLLETMRTCTTSTAYETTTGLRT